MNPVENISSLRHLILTIGLFAAMDLHAGNDESLFKSAAGECVEARTPGICMEVYGFECDWIGRTRNRAGDGILSCNAPMADGRKYFTQINSVDGVWVIYSQEAYLPERHVNWPVAASSFAVLVGVVLALLYRWRKRRKRTSSD